MKGRGVLVLHCKASQGFTPHRISTKAISMPCGLAMSLNSYNILDIITFLSSWVSVNDDETEYFKLGKRWNLPQTIFFGDETSTKNVVDSSTFCGLPASFSIIYSPNCMLSPSLRVASVELDEKQLGF